MYWSTLFASLLAVPACQARPSVEKRAGATGASLYAYGTNISGFPLYYADHNLYVSESNTTMAGLESITFDIPALTLAPTTMTTAWAANGTEMGKLWANVAGGTFDEVLVVPVDNGTVGFGVYGKQLVYYDGTNIMSEFWAKEMALGNGTAWALHWNSDNAHQAGATPVVIKTISSSS